MNKIDKIKEIAKILDDTRLTPETVVDLVGKVLKSLKGIQDNIAEQISSASNGFSEKTKEISAKLLKHDGALEKIVADINSSKDDAEEAFKSLESEMASMKGTLDEICAEDDSEFEKSVGDAIDEIRKDIEKISAQFADIKPLTAGEIRDALESLKNEDRLDVSAIKGLDELLDRIRKEVKGTKGTVYVGGASSRGLVKAYDLSPYLNGVTKTFAIPGAWRIIGVQSSSGPYAFRETTDFTWTQTSITFTSQIDAGSTLAAGQSLLLIYAEA